MNLTRCYKYRLYPTTDQQMTLAQWAGCRRYVWNWALRAKQAHYQATGKTLDYTALAAALTQLKRDTELAKSFSDAAISTFMQLLRDKAEWHGRQVVPVGRFFASSKTCHRCQQKASLTLADRVWTCRICDTTHDRDINAAINILHEGLRIVAAGMSETQNAAGDAVRPAMAGGR